MIAFKQFLRRLVVKLWIASKKVIEGVDITVKSYFLDNLYHLTAYPSDFSQTHIMDLLWGHICGCEVSREHGVDFLSAGQRANSRLGSTIRKVGLFDEGFELCVGRD